MKRLIEHFKLLLRRFIVTKNGQWLEEVQKVGIAVEHLSSESRPRPVERNKKICISTWL